MIVILFLFSLLAPLPAHAVTTVIGAQVQPPGPPLNTFILCQGGVPTCTRIMTPDWSNSQRWYGSNQSNCRISVNGARTWSNCPSNPSSTATYNHYAVTNKGTVLAAGNDSGGTVLRIRRSTDQATTWTTVYNAAPVDVASIYQNQRFHCAATISLCTFLFRDPGNNIISLTSTDDGQTWTVNASIGTSNVTTAHTSFANTGAIGQWGVLSADGFSNFRAALWNGATWTLSPIWPSTGGGLCRWNFVLNGSRRSICHVGGTGTTYEQRDENGTVIPGSSFTLSNVPSDNGGNSGLSISVRPSGIWMIRGTTAGRTGVWASLDGGASFNQIFETDTAGFGINQVGSIFEGLDGCIYASWLAGSSNETVIKICP